MSKKITNYITIKSKEYKAIKVLIGILIASNLILCFKGMALMQRNAELIKENNSLEQIIQIQKERLEEI